ncbi:Metallo-hydrolase/oxidoreductase [Panaeolus papilionaceus]|nr:Metallo-hydrolase/oxidoreductase [Panaeolus papilionaceus]
MSSLPPPQPSQTFCTVSALEAGLIDLSDDMFINNAQPGKVTRAPSLSFLIDHSPTNSKLIFDLGIRKDIHNYPPIIQKWIQTTYPVVVDQDALQSLSKGGLSPTDINYVILSHLHWDHTGDTAPFTNARFLVGGACKPLVTPGYPIDPNGRFASDLLPPNRTEFLDTSSDAWKPIGPFPRALDLFSDGSFYIIDSPGHLAGHVNALIRTSADGGWVYLAGDSAHHWHLITGESAVAVGHGGHLHSCAHENKEEAEAHIQRIHTLWKDEKRVRVMLAHDEPWYSKHKGGDSFWPGKIESL